MQPKTIDTAIMFADIVGSTKIYDTIGDERARAKIAATLKTMSEITKNNQGTVIKTIGDEVMCTFPTAEKANAAAQEMQETFEEESESNTDGSPIVIRVGMHFGSAIMEDGDVFGDTVNIAARMAAQAKAKQIITTQDTLDKLPASVCASARFVDRAHIKGKQETIDIFEIIWQEGDVTQMAVRSIVASKTIPETKLILTYRGETVELSKSRPSLIMGRGKNCDLTIYEELASRQHVRIELRKDKFFIVDQSTNGTHVITDNKPEEFLRREEISLTSGGCISLGKSFSGNPDEVVEFKLIGSQN